MIVFFCIGLWPFGTFHLYMLLSPGAFFYEAVLILDWFVRIEGNEDVLCTPSYGAPRPGQGVNILKCKENTDTKFLQLSGSFQDGIGVSCKPLYRFCV